MNNEIFSCEEHIDMAIDDFVNDRGQAPEVMMYSGQKCNYCSNLAVYIVKAAEEFI
jgi:CxxH/CxxC protein (TIGR04129 family)